MSNDQSETKKPLSSEHMSKIGRRGGNSTKRRKGKKFFSKISLKRKAFRGGRKPKPAAIPATTS